MASNDLIRRVEGRDWLKISSGTPSAEPGRVLQTTPHHIAVIVAHKYIRYGTIIEEAHHGHVLRCIKHAVFRAVRDVLCDNSRSRSHAGGGR